MRGKTASTQDGGRIEGWSLDVQELAPDENETEPSSVSTATGLRVSAPSPVKGHPAFPVEWSQRILPSRVRAEWRRKEDGLVVEMVVNTTPGQGPVAEWFRVRPPRGVTGNINDYRLPVRTMAKLAATEWGVEPQSGRDIYDLRQRHLKAEAEQRRRYEIVARVGDKAKAEGVSMDKAVGDALVLAGFRRPKKSTIYRWRSEARKLGLTGDAKATP